MTRTPPGRTLRPCNRARAKRLHGRAARLLSPDMGIWHVSLVLPQIVGPAATGWLITWLSMAVSDRFAYAVAFSIGALWLVLASVLVTHIHLPANLSQERGPDHT
jgi:hypothetical protein